MKRNGLAIRKKSICQRDQLVRFLGQLNGDTATFLHVEVKIVAVRNTY